VAIALPDWPRWLGEPLGAANYRERLEDFEVEEMLGFSADGEGPHQLLWVEKRGTNTAFAAQALALHAGVPERDIGYAGLKDRHALTRQYFSVPVVAGVDWDQLTVSGVRVLGVQLHRRKLRRGCHQGNRFRIVLRQMRCPDESLEQRLQTIATRGVPNYFGPQRFGRGGANLRLVDGLLSGKRFPRSKRGYAISALRSLVFNDVVAERLRQGSINQAIGGDLLQLDGRGSWFRFDPADPDIGVRLKELEIHPTGPLPGRPRAEIDGATAELEDRVLATHPLCLPTLDRLAVDADRRSLRMAVREFSWQRLADEVLELRFELSSGGYATSVMRELMELHDVHGQPEPEID